jgi:hypothetical protein
MDGGDNSAVAVVGYVVAGRSNMISRLRAAIWP